jgi:hypothetical protein
METLRKADLERLNIPIGSHRKPPGNTAKEIWDEVQRVHPSYDLSEAKIQEYLNDSKYPHRKTCMCVCAPVP